MNKMYATVLAVGIPAQTGVVVQSMADELLRLSPLPVTYNHRVVGAITNVALTQNYLHVEIDVLDGYDLSGKYAVAEIMGVFHEDDEGNTVVDNGQLSGLRLSDEDEGVWTPGLTRLHTRAEAEAEVAAVVNRVENGIAHMIEVIDYTADALVQYAEQKLTAEEALDRIHMAMQLYITSQGLDRAGPDMTGEFGL